jgi:ElaB/YqjD/DUF883 family membrane-anchored ribosome-binding protein
MSTDAGTRRPEDIRRGIEHTREELAETAAALAYRADVKARAHEKLDETKARFTHKVEDAKAKVTGTAGAAKGKAAEATPASVATGAQHAAETVQAKARANPVQAAAVAGFAAGLLVGWLLRR